MVRANDQGVKQMLAIGIAVDVLVLWMIESVSLAVSKRMEWIGCL